jgi:hypothetical protein
MPISKKVLFVLIFAGIACLISVHIQKSEAQDPIFFADFDAEGIPDNGVNDPGNWKPENPANIWAIGDFPANGTKCLQQVGSGCGASGFTPFPTVENWSNGVIQVDLGLADNDSWGLMFRRQDQMTGYFVFLGYSETLSLALIDLAQGCGRNGVCLNETGCEQGPDGAAEVLEEKALKVVPHNLPAPLSEAADVSYTARIVARGPKIKIWYGLTKDFSDNPLEDPDPNAIASYIEVEDSTYTSGSVGIWHESNDNGRLDNIYVFDARALAVGPQAKLATTWGALKAP